MYNFIKKFMPIALLVSLCTGCGGGIEIGYEDKSYSTDTISADAKIPQISGLASDDLEEKINHEFMTVCTDMLGEFSESAKETKERSVFGIETTEHYNSAGFLSMTADIAYTAKKTRRISSRICKNIDTASCIEVSFSDLFADDSYIDMLNERLSAEVSKNPEKYADLWEKPRLASGQEYYVNDQNLVIFYPPYELSYYERGFVEFSVPLSEISGYLKPEYRKILVH